jgi:hypothetical protein
MYHYQVCGSEKPTLQVLGGLFSNFFAVGGNGFRES